LHELICESDQNSVLSVVSTYCRKGASDSDRTESRNKEHTFETLYPKISWLHSFIQILSTYYVSNNKHIELNKKQPGLLSQS
jgi:predicted neuraminidase